MGTRHVGFTTFLPLSSLSFPRSCPCPVYDTLLLALVTKTSPPPLVLSHRPNVSFSPFDSLSLPLTHFYLFLLQIRSYGIINGGSKFKCTHRQEEVRGVRDEGSQHLGRRSTVLGGGRSLVGGCGKDNSKMPSPATPTTISRSPQVPFNLLVVLVPSICDESGRIVGTHFCTNY